MYLRRSLISLIFLATFLIKIYYTALLEAVKYCTLDDGLKMGFIVAYWCSCLDSFSSFSKKADAVSERRPSLQCRDTPKQSRFLEDFNCLLMILLRGLQAAVIFSSLRRWFIDFENITCRRWFSAWVSRDALKIEDRVYPHCSVKICARTRAGSFSWLCDRLFPFRQFS